METKNDLKTVGELLKHPDFNRVLVCCHASPDGDAVGSAFSLAYGLRKLGKESRVFCPDPFPELFSEIWREEETLFPFVPEHFVTVDVAAPSMLGGADFAERIEVVIDHHRINTVSAKHKLVLPDRASCGEIVLALLREMPLSFDAYLARALYTAIATDTGCFRFANTNENTFLSVAFLYPFADPGDFYRINKRVFETKSHRQLKLERFAMENVSFFAEEKGAILSVSLKKQEELGVSYSDLDCLINVIRQVEGVKVSIVAKEKENGVFKVSVRSEEGFDASDFCALFGGGGHRAAAGCTLEGTEEEVLSALMGKAEGRLS